MRYYKDFNYIKYMLNLEFKSGFKLYLKCIKLLNEEKEKEIKDKIFQIWLIDIQNGYKGNFEKYYQDKIRKVEESNLTRKEKISEEQRINKKVELKKHAKMEEVKFNL